MKYTPEQKKAIVTTGEHISVSAGAGSGKTRVLVDRIVHLLEKDVPISAIVAITFTRKAAAEMHHRIIAALLYARDDPEPSEPHKLLTWQFRAVQSTDDGLLRNAESNSPSNFELLTQGTTRRAPRCRRHRRPRRLDRTRRVAAE